jgi:hypothetical protein
VQERKISLGCRIGLENSSLGSPMVLAVLVNFSSLWQTPEGNNLKGGNFYFSS